jgi:PAS domain S-box-containing protein
VVETMAEGLLVADRQGKVVYANPAMQAITGYEREEYPEPVGWSRLLHPDDLVRGTEMLAAALAGRVERGELRYRAKNGSETIAFVVAQPLWQKGAVAGTTTLLVDVTRERQLERELQCAQRLELIARLSSGIAHDFNNLLLVVLTLADLARSHLPAEHPVHADLRRISEAGEQAASLAAQLLAFCKQRPLSTRRVPVNQIVQRTLELLRATLRGRIEVLEVLSDEDLFIQVDETQLQQVLMNLCLNARDAMPGGGTLRIQTRCYEPARAKDQAPPDILTAGRAVLLSVYDSGVGMSEQVRARIFDPFFSTKDGGTGLGLAVVHQIVESYGGRIEVSSQPGKGARFDVWWPAASN